VNDAAFRAAAERLAGADVHLRRLVEEHGVPPYWSRPAGFPTLVLLILEQQVSLASAAAAFRRLEDRTGAVTPESLLASSVDDLRSDGFSRQKTRYTRALAEAVLDGGLDLDALERLPDDEIGARLMSLPGIGPWTADVYLLACLHRPDVWPVGDRALQVAVAETLELERVPDQAALVGIGERWRPHRSTAARLLWHGYLSRRGRS
jgi:DNA-3-methyladenine glycosylase II